MSTPPQANKDFNSQSNRLRASSSIAPISPNLLHRTITGRIGRSRSASSLLSTRNRRTANSESARNRIWQYNRAEQTSEAHLSLPEYIAPQSLAVLSPLTAASAESNLPPLEAIPRFEETVALVREPSSLGQIGRSREGLSSMEFMMPPQYQPHEQSFGHFPSSYLTSSYIDQYSSAESEHAMAQTSSQPAGYTTSYATSPPLNRSPLISQRGGSPERDSNPGYQYAASAIRSPSYHGGTSSPQPNYSYTTAQVQPYIPAYSAPSDYTHNHAHAQYHPTYEGHYSSSYQQTHAPGALAPLQHYGSSHDHMGYEHDAAGVRVVNDRPKPQCFEHGCNGRQFSTFSNLLRHQREKSGKAQKSNCPKCGAEFTRTTARNGHILHDKCKKRGSGSSPS